MVDNLNPIVSPNFHPKHTPNDAPDNHFEDHTAPRSPSFQHDAPVFAGTTFIIIGTKVPVGWGHSQDLPKNVAIEFTATLGFAPVTRSAFSPGS